ncbi:hypothetical protein [Pedobacter sp.]
MRLFGKAKKEELSRGQEAFAVRMADRICTLQRRVSDRLNRLTAGFGRSTWIFLLVLGCTGFGSYCAYLVWNAFN